MASNVFLILACKLFPVSDLTFLIVIVIIAYCFKNHEAHPEMSDNLNYFDLSAVPLFFGVAVFDFEGNGVVINLHASMREPEKFRPVLIGTVSLYIFIICSFSTIAYWVRPLSHTLV